MGTLPVGLRANLLVVCPLKITVHFGNHLKFNLSSNKINSYL